jgi:parallel beta-helix repeat protein
VNSAQSDVYNNTCNGNSNYGVYLLVSHQGEFYDNVCNFNSYGIYLTNSQQNNISNNTYANNGIFGIYLIGTSLNNIVEWNVFTENTNSGLDSASPTNTFDYNFWSDYNGIDADQNAIGDTPYQVWGSAGNRDLHPLMLLPNQEIGWIDPPSDQVYEYGEPVIYDVDASAFSGIDYWTVNDTTNFSIDSFGGITNSTILSIGTYGLDISVYDNKGNFLSEIFTVTVASITPTWIEEPTDQLVIYPKAFRYDLNATDYDGLDMWWINDTINFVIDQTGLIVNATILEIKEYGIEVFVNDTLGNILASTFRVTVVKYTEHDPIVIVGDNEFSDIAALEGWQGDGTSQSPFIIELLSIDRNDNAGHCVSISNTLVNFTIKECLLVGASVNPGAGIYLNNVSHGNIIENTFDNNFFNIYLWSSHYVSIINNTCPNSEYSISLLQISSYNNITNNNCSYNNDRGINLASGSHRNVVADNTCNFNTYGIVLHGAHTNTIVGNTLNNNSQDGIHNNDADGNLMVNNTCNGNIYGIYIHSRNIYNKVINNTCNENSRGIYLYFEAFHVDIINNICYKNDDAGIYLQEDASGCVLTNNSCTFNGYGVYFVSFSMDNVITWNVFANNSIENGWDSGLNNVFDYNYWSDYDGVDANGDRIGDTPYTVPGSLGSQDLHPLMKPPGALSWIGILSNQIIELGESFQYELNATSSDDLDIWWLNDTTYFNIDQLGVITNITILDLGTFPLQVFVNDISGDTISVIFSVFVVDSPPIWSEMPTNQYIRFGDSFYYELSATDSIGIDSWWINDTINFNIDQTGVITNATIFPLGVFILQVNVTDTGGNTISAVFTVSISFYMPHDAILIDSDQSFADTALTKGWEGEGSAASPFIITRLEIDRGSGGGRCISISHTRVHFIIIDCVLIGGSAYQGAGIYLYNVTNGKIINNTCVYNYYGIYLYNSSFITISDNFCSYSPYSGVYLFSNCFNNTLTNNTCKNKEIGIHIFSS